MADLLTPDTGADGGDYSLAGSMQALLRAFARDNLDDMLPAKVVSYNQASNRAVIQPLVMIGTTDGAKVSRARCANVPVFRFGGGGFFIAMPLKAGDFGWLKANDRDTSLIFQGGGQEDWPNTERLHSFSDAMFFPDTLKDWAINGKNADALVIQSLAGETCLALADGRVEIDSTEIKLNGDVFINGGLSTSGGDVSIAGNIATTGNISNNGKDIGSGHKHSGVQAGGDDTGEVV